MPEFDVLINELQPWISIDGVKDSLGIFIPTTQTVYDSEDGRSMRIECYDRSWRVMAKKATDQISIAAGANYVQTIQQLVTACGIKMTAAEPSDDALQTARNDWDIGTSYLDIINTLLAEINYRPLWFDNLGIARISPHQEPSASRIAHRYSSKQSRAGARIMVEKQIESDAFDVPNVIIALCSNPELPQRLIARAENNSPTSKTSTVRRGIEIVHVENIENIASQAALQQLADRLRNDAMFATSTITFSSQAEPGHGAYDIVSIDADSLCSGIYEETSWSLSMSAGAPMQHTAVRRVIT
jgi:hypothetical protein